jgi:putative SOS response-associated peptidase YedK
MCGRFSFSEDWSLVLNEYGLSHSDYHEKPRYNVAPGQMITAVIYDGEKRRIGPLKWGLIPHWAKDPSIGYKTINARAETLTDKPAFRHLIKRKRCLIPADGFYEWRKIGSKKEPMRIVLQDRKLFAMAGLYDTWIAPDGQKISSCTIITTAPNELMAEIHNRMPVILPKGGETLWLSKVEEFHALEPLLRAYPTEKMRAYKVSELVGNVKNDIPLCI